ncbi:MAG TPA: hypothetical protein VKY74_13165 [Chloroflexia bacterium]|nr:hypothetical protein [Chloroflexia bacterium]
MTMAAHDSLYTWLVDANQVAFAQRDYPAARQALESALAVAVAGRDGEAVAEVTRLGQAQQAWMRQHEPSGQDVSYTDLLQRAQQAYRDLTSPYPAKL